MTSFCLLLVGASVSFVISRICKSAKMYVGLICILLLGFVLGSGIKESVANDSNVPSQELAIVATSNPTFQGMSTAVVGTVDNHSSVMSQDLLEGDTVTVASEKLIPKMPNNTEIEDDS